MITQTHSVKECGLKRPDVSFFFSYAREDEAVAHVLIRALKDLRAQVWADKSDLHPGDSFAERIGDAIAEAQVFIQLVSPASIRAYWCQKELSLALARNGEIHILPLRLNDAEMPSLLRDLVNIEVDSNDLLTSVAQLVSAVRPHLGQLADEPGTVAEKIDPVQSPIAHSCPGFVTIPALRALRESPGELELQLEHLFGCPRCQELIKVQFLLRADRQNPEVGRAIALGDGTLSNAPAMLAEILECEAATPEVLAEYERWQKDRRGAIDPQAIPRVILASYDLRYAIDSSLLVRYARLATEMADAVADPWLQAIGHIWLARVFDIRRELGKASRELETAKSAMNRLEGPRRLIAQAFLLYQSADHHMRLQNFSEAREIFERAIALFRQLSLPSLARYAEFGLAFLCCETGEYEEARSRILKILSASRDRLIATSALSVLTGDILPNLAREGRPELAEQALCLKLVAGEINDPEIGIRGRHLWRDGRIAWALGAPKLALTFYDRARSEFLRPVPDKAGMYEAAAISLDMLLVRLESGSPAEVQASALEAASLFHKLGVDASCLLEFGSLLPFNNETDAGTHLSHARIALKLAKKRWLLEAATEEASPYEEPDSPEKENQDVS